jgi:acyl carrier protein phosphodiesterase
MNFLAHAYLSFHQPGLLVGNMISDFVKGSAKFTYSPSIQQGIDLHRRIDAFTDTHRQTKRAKEIFRKDYRLYSAPIVDILFDHYLAVDQNIFTKETLYHFSLEVYVTLENHALELPPHFLLMLPYMKEENWLFHYSDKSGMRKSLRGLVRRSTFLTDHETAFALFEKHYFLLADCYAHFFEDVKAFAKKEIGQLHL